MLPYDMGGLGHFSPFFDDNVASLHIRTFFSAQVRTAPSTWPSQPQGHSLLRAAPASAARGPVVPQFLQKMGQVKHIQTDSHKQLCQQPFWLHPNRLDGHHHQSQARQHNIQKQAPTHASMLGTRREHTTISTSRPSATTPQLCRSASCTRTLPLPSSWRRTGTVSYTHLTLPTIRSV